MSAVGDTGAVNPAARDLTDAALAADLAAEAGELLLEVRDEVGFDYPWELGDAGDRLANALILRRLRAERPGDAVLSEEAHDDLVRLKSDRVWIVDPLDGTREFSTRGRDDWAVHIALWQRPVGGSTAGAANGAPQITDAAVSLPARGNIVYRSDTVTDLVDQAVPAGTPGVIRIAVSATRPPAILYRIRQILDIELVRIGSAGAKAMAVILGQADIYLHSGGQHEWDSMAPVAVAAAHGLHCSRIDGSPLLYNCANVYMPDLLICRKEHAGRILELVAEIGAEGGGA